VRRSRADAARRAHQLGHDARHLDVVAVARGLREDHVACPVMRVFGDIARRVDLAGRDTRLAQRIEHLGDAVFGRPGADRAVDLVDACDAARIVGEVRRFGQVGPADGEHEALEDAVAIARHEHDAVAATVRIRRCDARQRTAARLAHGAERAVFGDQAFHHVEHRLMQGDVDHLSLAAIDLAVVQRSQDADHAMQRGEGIADRHAAAHRHPPRLAGEVAQAAHRLADHAEARQVAVRAGLAITRDAQHDEARIQLRQHIPAHAPAFQRTRAEILDQHVGFGDELARDLLPFAAAQIERQRALVARLDLPPDGGPLLHHAPVAQRIAAVGRLDLDHVGAEIAERLAGEGAGDELAHFDDAYACERSVGGVAFCVHYVVKIA